MQYGFRGRRGTLDALGRVCGIADLCHNRGLVCVLFALDVKNGFNTLSCKSIPAEVRESRLPGKLLNLLNNYLSDRKIVVHCQDGTVRRSVYVGVAQGSIIGPLLWNLVYDGLLKVLYSVKDLDAIALRDHHVEVAGGRVQEAMKLVTDWCKGTSLHLAQDKKDVILLTWK